MKRCLIVKTSSLGDVIHTLPALSEAKQHCPDIEFDWVVEKSFAEIPSWHDAVNEVLPVEIRKWRKNILKYWPEIKRFKKKLKSKKYDYIIDGQGLLKSAWVAFCAKGQCYGLDKHSAREPLASKFYHQKFAIERKQHAVIRLKELFAQVLGYHPNDAVDYGISYQWDSVRALKQVVLLHATTWSSKHWALSHWQQLAQKLALLGYQVLIPWGNEKEKRQAQNIAQGLKQAVVLNKLTLSDLAQLFSQSQLVISVDTGLSHLSAACDVPVIGIYGSTSANLTGAIGKHVEHVSSNLTCAPCLKKVCPITKDEFAPCEVSITVDKVLSKMQHLLLEAQES